MPDIGLEDIKNYTEDNEICCFIAKMVDFCVLAPIHHKDKWHVATVHIAQRQHFLPFR